MGEVLLRKIKFDFDIIKTFSSFVPTMSTHFSRTGVGLRVSMTTQARRRQSDDLR